MSYLTITARDIEALVKAVKLGEEVKPSQQAKRDVFSQYGITGTYKDRVLTAIYYDLWKRIGIIDRVGAEIVGVSNVAILDPWLRAALRVAIELLIFERHLRSSAKDARNLVIKYLKGRVSKLLSEETHPYVGMFFWDLVDKIAQYRFEPSDVIERWELRYLVSRTIIKRLISLVGREETKKILRAFNQVPPISVRVNVLKATVDEVIKELKREGVNPIRGRYVDTVLKFRGPYDFDRSQLYRSGKIVIQDEAAALASILLDPKPGEVVIDMCAAPGGKTEHMGELMRNNGVIHAFDIDPVRIRRMKMLLKRAGISIARIYREDVRKAPKILGEEVADKVLLDAPCTSSGTIAKNHELRWRIQERKIQEMAKLQLELLRTAIKLAKPGGRILYTTCSLFKEENEDVISKILREYEGVIKLVPLRGPMDEGFLPGTMRAWPHKHGTLGFFYALLEKVKSV
ncbi:MAG: RsmB/NOP family class I SAM-dependent RNA methyltransferase [Crenarchaeota archaeon]|nr:RsmB/NOP family class I SAM-dependent RNA methyltransferase [Thermoproteota archaeon]